MSSTQVDLYSGIHRGLRNLIGQFSVRAGALDWSDQAAVDKLAEEWHMVAGELLSHHGHEEKVLFPILARNTPGGAHRYEVDHDANRAALADLSAHLQGLCGGQVPAPNRASVGMEFFRGVNLFYARVLEHMHLEETDAQRALDDLCETEELGAALGAIIGSMQPEQLMRNIDYMFPALSIHEAAGLLRGMKASAPPDVYAALAARVRQARGEGDWPRLEALTT